MRPVLRSVWGTFYKYRLLGFLVLYDLKKGSRQIVDSKKGLDINVNLSKNNKPNKTKLGYIITSGRRRGIFRGSRGTSKGHVGGPSESNQGGGLRCPIGLTGQLMGTLIICKAVQVVLRVQWGQGGLVLRGRKGVKWGPMRSRGMSGGSHGAFR